MEKNELRIKDKVSLIRRELGFIEPDLTVQFGHGSKGMPYLSLGKLLSTINPLLEKYELGVMFDGTEVIKSDCEDSILRFHVSLHDQNEEVNLTYDLVVDNSNNRSSVQNYGSTISYGMRYIYKLIFTIPSGEYEDPDLANGYEKAENENKLIEYYELSKKFNDSKKGLKIFTGLVKGDLNYDSIKSKFNK